MSVHSSPTAWRKEQPWPQQWRNANGPGVVDDSLTNLQWLQEFSILTDDPEKPATSSLLGHLKAPQDSDAPASPPVGDTAAAEMSPRLEKPPCSTSSSPFQASQNTVDYRTNSQVKPPHSYATLICMAMQASRGAKVTLSTIYAWITENFCYYRQADPSWQNSIRHNLSLNKCFRKVPRRKDEPGKGGFWQIDPQYADVFVNGVFRRRRVLAFPSTSAQPSTASSVELGSCRGAGQGQGPGQPLPRLLGPPRRVARGKPLPAPCASGAAWTTPPSPPASVGTGPGALSWASTLEETLAGGSGSSFEDLELTAALGALATGEGLAPHGHPLGAPSEGGGASPAADHLADGLALCTEPWEEVVAERTLGAPWAFEEGACFAEGFLAEMQPWEV